MKLRYALSAVLALFAASTVLAFNFSVPKYSQDVTRVSIDIMPQEDGCELTLTHQGVLPEYASSTKEGWTGILDGLAKLLE